MTSNVILTLVKNQNRYYKTKLITLKMKLEQKETTISYYFTMLFSCIFILVVKK